MNFFVSSYGLETVFVLTFLLLILVGIRTNRNFWKHAFYNLAAVFFTLFIYELFLTIQSFPNTTLTRDLEYFQSDSLLGYSAVGPEAYEVNVMKKFADSEDTIYHARYGFENRYRKTKSADSTQTFAIFLGGSLIFGEGVNDNETLPSRYGEFVDDTQVLNYGFHGYGPHQVLMQLKHRVFQENKMRIDKRGYVYYLFIPQHISRAHGRTDWDNTGPYFYLEQDSLVWGGTFYDKRVNTSPWVKLLRALVLKSRIYNLHFRASIERRYGDLNLILQMLYQMKAIVDKQGLEFRVILEYQPVSKPLIDDMKTAMDQRDIMHIDTYDAIPNKTLENPNLYIEGDLHPSPKFNQLLAEYLHKHLTLKSHEGSISR